MTPRCNALAAVPGGLDLVAPSGSVLSRFNTGGAPLPFVALSPDGSKVAYATDQMAKSFSVINSMGQRGRFKIYPKNRAYDAYLMGLHWNSNNVVRLTTFWGKDYAKFDFRRIPTGLASPATTAASPAMEDNCVLDHAGGQVACIDPGGIVFLGGGINVDQGVYSVSGFEGVKPLESFTVHVNDGVTPQVGPPYKITIKSISHNKMMVVMDTPDPRYESGAYATQIENGSYAVETDYGSGAIYGYRLSILDARKGLVRIEVVKSNAPQNPFDSGLAWQARGQGLIFVQRTNTQTFLDLIRPGNGHAGDGSAKNKTPQWHLAAQAPMTLPGKVRAMRFLAPSLLLLDTGDFRGPRYGEVTVHIAKDAETGKPRMTVGTVKPLPSAVSIKQSGKTTEGRVLDWSCTSARGYGGGD